MAAYFLLLSIVFVAVVNCKDVAIKIVDAPHQSRHTSSSLHSRKLVLRGPPALISGPPHMRAIIGECFETRYRNYLYSVCPFHNVTQKEESNMWNRFHGVLGVWREWVIEDDRFVGMLYAFGEKCGKTNREAKIMFKCSTITKLTNITEPKTCKYVIWMWTPLACFKGAMQVYRVLTPEQIATWEELDSEYHSDIITKQGLLKKRRQLLLSAGLYYNFTRDEEYDGTTNKDNSYSYTTSSTKQVHSSSSCQIQLDKAEKELKQVKLQLSNYQKAFSLNPSLKLQLDQLLLTIVNHSNATGKPTSSNATNISPKSEHKPVVKQPRDKQSSDHNQPVDKPLDMHPVDGIFDKTTDKKYVEEKEKQQSVDGVPAQQVNLPVAQPVEDKPMIQPEDRPMHQPEDGPKNQAGEDRPMHQPEDRPKNRPGEDRPIHQPEDRPMHQPEDGPKNRPGEDRPMHQPEDRPKNHQPGEDRHQTL